MFKDSEKADRQPNEQEAGQSSPCELGAELTETAAEERAESELTAGAPPATNGSSASETAANQSELASVPVSEPGQASRGEISPDSVPSGQEQFEQDTEKSAEPAPASAISRRVAANRANAKKSTGPRTARGKAISRFNATRHGLLSRKTLFHGSGQPVDESLQALMEGLREKYGTGDITLELLLETTVVDYYRNAKALEHENRLFSTRWSFAQQGEMPCLQRYVTASRNALLKDLQLLEQLRARQAEERRDAEGDSGADCSSDPAAEEAPADADAA